MATATLYIRVSTDEQAIRGFSQSSQEDRLKAHCTYQGYTILQVVFEDHTAKTFNRPAWNALMKGWREHPKQRPNHLLFTRWDRFSRNTTDSYYMINRLKRWGIEPQAIDQPLDLSIPENKLMLALYLATSEVENERRALNIKQGMYKARQEGRWTGKAPLGYINRITTPNGEKIIAPKEPEATLLQKVFRQIAESNTTINSIYKKTLTWGLKCSRSNFYRLLQNPVYYGMVVVPAFERKQAYLTKGIHQGIISEELFDQVQRFLKRRNRLKAPSPKLAPQYLPLRGYIHCPHCGKRLTGSGSRGHYKRYYYYHCVATCGYRVRADGLNLYFQEELNRLTPGEVYVTLFHSLLKELIQLTDREQRQSYSRIVQSMEGQIHRSVRALELLHKGDINDEDYLLIKENCEKRMKILGQEIRESTMLQMKEKARLEKHARILKKLGKVYEKGILEIKRRLIALILSEKAVLEPGKFDTALDLAAAIVFGKNPNLIYVDVGSSNAMENGDPNVQMIREAERKEGREIPMETVRCVLLLLQKLSKLLIFRKQKTF